MIIVLLYIISSSKHFSSLYFQITVKMFFFLMLPQGQQTDLTLNFVSEKYWCADCKHRNNEINMKCTKYKMHKCTQNAEGRCVFQTAIDVVSIAVPTSVSSSSSQKTNRIMLQLNFTGVHSTTNPLKLEDIKRMEVFETRRALGTRLPVYHHSS